MRKSTDTLGRQWELLSMIPREPLSVSVVDIAHRLRNRGYEVDIRTVQRDIFALERRFGLICETKGRKHLWSWSRKHPVADIPTMSTLTAITLLLARDYLVPVLPKVVLDELSPYFSKAQQILKGTRYSAWQKRVAMINSGPELAAPKIDSYVYEAVQNSLLDDRQLKLRYRSRLKGEMVDAVVQPLALVSREGVFYLVATFWDYDDIRHLALHRIGSAQVLEEKAKRPKTFDLQNYIRDAHAFEYPDSGRHIRLEALFDSEAALHLAERALSSCQELVEETDGRIRLSACVADTRQLSWWLLGFGDQVEVLKPAKLRREFEIVAERMANKYLQNNT